RIRPARRTSSRLRQES
ncbi:hypothetical protein V3C99_018637, partial [Haemonchus contortus]